MAGGMCPPGRKYIQFTAIFLALGFSFAVTGAASPVGQDLSASEIVRRSVAVNTADWKAQPNFVHREQDVKSKENSNGEVTGRQEKTFEIRMIDGTPYERLIEINYEPLDRAQNQQEQNKLKRETASRRHESGAERRERLNKYQSERAEEKLLMDQMADAFRFTLTGEEDIDGVSCYVLDAKPDPKYRPPNQRARVLLGMRGRLYIDKAGFHWVRVQAQVISPVEFGIFLARVKPGTSFELDQAPVGDAWLPKHFVQSVNTTVLGVYEMRNKEEELYSDYRPLHASAQSKQQPRTNATSASRPDASL
jgi:hypothetical protein